ncbi:hypothetical protein AF332_20765 [Sporosarcina globispora]|uniref:Uncharacterized protein n=1 Tax=Sporosarcina globispora TaxID=1459 RepID=A0A0M0GGF2_SPOGL|nr:hypothetical protein [Sporosarcina globispora]KON88980.1 hypothetical protein AF332_20765 [Sporosarcina globispora]
MKTEMLINQQLEIIQEAIEAGADIRVCFHRIPSLKEGKKIIERMSALTGASVESSECSLSLNTFETPLDCTVFYKLSLEEQKEKLLQELNRMNAELAKGDETIEQAN